MTSYPLGVNLWKRRHRLSSYPAHWACARDQGRVAGKLAGAKGARPWEQAMDRNCKKKRLWGVPEVHARPMPHGKCS